MATDLLLEDCLLLGSRTLFEALFAGGWPAFIGADPAAEQPLPAVLSHVVAPLRPTLKHRYPLTPVEDYVAWTRADGSAFDPWLRSHQRMGATVLGTSPASQTFTGTVQQWEEWSGIDLPGDGSYIVRDALSPLHIDRRADAGTCVEPAIWVQHR